MSGHRKAALALHALGRDDRAMVLAALPDADQRILRAHLDELAELGFDASTAEIALRDTCDPTPHEAIAAADPDDILHIVGNEPAALIGVLLNAGPWAWEAAFLARLPAHLRLRLETCRADETQRGQRRAAFVVDAVARALPAGAVEGQPAKRVPFSTIRTWFGTWKR
jgi:hypothetical protein